MKCLIIYYSLTNSTGRVSQSIAEGLLRSGCSVTQCNIKDQAVPDLKGFDLIGVGSPVYYYQIPRNVLEFLESLPIQKGVRSFAFLTNGSYAWNAGEKLEKAMQKKGFHVTGWFYCHGTGYFLPYIRLGYLESPNYPSQEDLTRAEQFGYDMGTGSDGMLWPEKSAKPPVIYRLEQVLTHRILIKAVYQKMFSLDKGKCIRCGLCVKGCPVHNLTKDTTGYPHWNKQCIMCLSCEMHCPKEAIRSPVSWAIMKPLVKYNVKKIRNDPELDKVRTSHRNGKIEFL